MSILIDGVICNNPNKLEEVSVGMWFKSTEGHIDQVKHIHISRGDSMKYATVYCKDNTTCWGLDNIVQTSWNPEDLKSKEEKFKDFLNQFKGFKSKINTLIKSYSDATDRSCSLRNIEIDPTNLLITINLIYHKNNEANFDTIFGETEIFYNDEMFNKYIENNKIKTDERKSIQLEKENKKKEFAIEQAKQLLRAAGIDVNDSTWRKEPVNGNNYRN
jgi:hypothetical protein